MATTKSRINITADLEFESALKNAAKRDRVPVATKAAELIAVGLNLEEDLALAALADSRQNIKGDFISHDQAWK